MTTKLKLIALGNDVGIVLPTEVLVHLGVTQGDMLYATETDGGIELRTSDTEFEEDMKIAEKIMSEDRDVLRRLAE